METRSGKLIDTLAIARRLRITRDALSFNKREFCREAGIGESAYNQYENGARPLTILSALKLCERFGLTLDWLYRGDRSGLPARLATRLPRFSLVDVQQDVVAKPAHRAKEGPQRKRSKASSKSA